MSKINNKFVLGIEQHKDIFNTIKELYFNGKKPSQHSVTAFIGGQPGAGKSSLTKNAENKFMGNVVIIDPDELRDQHPDYENLLQSESRIAAALVHPDASAWAKELFNEAVKGNYNLILDGTMGNTGKIISQCHQLREAGYHTEVHLMAANSLMSRLGIQQRYEGQIQKRGFGRWVDKEIHDEAFTGIPDINYLLYPKQQTPASIISKTKTTSSNKPNYYRHKQHKKSACQLAENWLAYRYSVWSRYSPSLPVVLLCQREI